MRRDRAIYLRAALDVLLAVVLIAAAIGFVEDVRNTRDYGGVDLRNRVVGARLMLEGMDPYHFKWSEEYPERLLDPSDNPENEVSRVTVPPTVLALHMTMAWLPYRAQRTLWLYVQWSLLLASLLLFSRCARTGEQARAVWIVGLLLSSTTIWRFHVERGQIYVLYALLIALSFWLSRRPWRYAAQGAGAALGLATAMRPTLALMAIPLLVFGKTRITAGLVSALAILLLLSVVLFGMPVWRDYLSAMRYHERDNLGMANPVGMAYRAMTIEGMDDLDTGKYFTAVNTSLQWFLKRYLAMDVKGFGLLLMLGPLLLAITMYLLKYRRRIVSLVAAYLTGTAMVLVSEYFIPAIKPAYVNIMWLAPASLAVLGADELTDIPRRHQALGLLTLQAGVFFCAYSPWREDAAFPGEALIVLFFLLAGFFMIKASPDRPTSDRQADEALVPPAGTDATVLRPDGPGCAAEKTTGTGCRLVGGPGSDGAGHLPRPEGVVLSENFGMRRDEGEEMGRGLDRNLPDLCGGGSAPGAFSRAGRSRTHPPTTSLIYGASSGAGETRRVGAGNEAAFRTPVSGGEWRA